MKFDKESFLFTIDLKNLYSNISVKDAMELMRRLFFKYQNVIPNPPFKFRANVTGVKLCCNEISKKFFKQILGIVVATNLAPILANI